MSSFKRFYIPGTVLLLTLGALGLYAATMGQTLVLEHGGSDGAELAVAVHTLGIPHPTGYPTYVLLAQAFQSIPWGSLVSRLNLFSACAAALTVGLVSLSAACLFPPKETFLPALSAALTAGLTLTAGGLFWSQALIAEVYTLHSAFLALLIWLMLRWHHRDGWALPLAGLVFGLGLGNHVSLLFLLPAIAVLLYRSRVPRGKALLATGLLLLGLGVYLYLPLRALADPWLNWGDPRSWPAFWGHISGQSYRTFLFQVPWSQVLARLASTARLLLADMAPWGVLLGLAGLVLLSREDRPTLALTAIPAVLGTLLALTYGGADSQVHLLPLYLAWALWAGLAGGSLVRVLYRRLGRRAVLVTALLSLLPLLLLPRGWSTWSLRNRTGPLPILRETLDSLPAGALLLSETDEQTFPLWYAQVVDGSRPDVVLVDTRLLEWPWYRQQLPSRYPGLVLPRNGPTADWLHTLLQGNIERPAFSLTPLALPEGYRLRPAGPIYQILPSQ